MAFRKLHGVTWTYNQSPEEMWNEEDFTIHSDGTVTWDINNALVPGDVVEVWEKMGYPVNHENHMEARAEDLRKLREQMRGQKPSREERAEARAAYGPGVEIVNVITGESWIT